MPRRSCLPVPGSSPRWTYGDAGKWAPPPDQVTILNEVFSPTQERSGPGEA